MKAVAFRQNLPVEHPDSLVDIDLPRPEVREHDLLVRIEAVAVNPVDTKVRRFHAPPADGSWRVPGWDAAGVVEAVGDQVSRFRPGDRVWYAGDLTRQGSHAEYQAVDARLVGRMPESLDFAEAAALPLTAITAAVVGVVLNLALFFGYHVLWPQGFGGSFEWMSALIAVGAAVALFRFKANVIHVIGACAVIGLVLQLTVSR